MAEKEEKSAFYGDVGQAVVGNVHEAPRLNNIVQIVGREKPEPTPVKVLTKLQRSAIFAKVKDVAAASGMKTYDVYNVIKIEFGVEKIEEVPLDSYKAVMTLLSQSLDEATGNVIAGTRLEDLDDLPKASAVPIVASVPVVTACLVCAEKSAVNARLQQSIRVQLIALVALTVGCGWLLYRLPPAGAELSSVPAETSCFIEGASYSIGSTAKMPNGLIRECIQSQSRETPRWSMVLRK